jgi:hypothetical protein
VISLFYGSSGFYNHYPCWRFHCSISCLISYFLLSIPQYHGYTSTLYQYVGITGSQGELPLDVVSVIRTGKKNRGETYWPKIRSPILTAHVAVSNQLIVDLSDLIITTDIRSCILPRDVSTRAIVRRFHPSYQSYHIHLIALFGSIYSIRLAVVRTILRGITTRSF